METEQPRDEPKRRRSWWCRRSFFAGGVVLLLLLVLNVTSRRGARDRDMYGFPETMLLVTTPESWNILLRTDEWIPVANFAWVKLPSGSCFSQNAGIKNLAWGIGLILAAILGIEAWFRRQQKIPLPPWSGIRIHLSTFLILSFIASAFLFANCSANEWADRYKSLTEYGWPLRVRGQFYSSGFDYSHWQSFNIIMNAGLALTVMALVAIGCELRIRYGRRLSFVSIATGVLACGVIFALNMTDYSIGFDRRGLGWPCTLAENLYDSDSLMHLGVCRTPWFLIDVLCWLAIVFATTELTERLRSRLMQSRNGVATDRF